MTAKTNNPITLGRYILLAGLLLTAACSNTADVTRFAGMDLRAGLATKEPTLDENRVAFAIAEAAKLRARGQRVWCVPFARNASGIQLRGNAHLWWNAAVGKYARGNEPQVGAVMVFSASRSMKIGHVAVVSKVVSDREILIDHANWKRNQVTRGQRVVDVSKNGDWSAVKVESAPGSLGRTNPVSGFVYSKALSL
ncbi:CHAP domain protein [Aquimixticola soesokkakensis]|uniref:CHAP domain protein n=1 Tax=Aquimixticola soesokkakensis TaxID=1519096 RepID=A0A1Y5S2W4_9RHOB|nr:CHAP domain-containing protein [Aquimixticola soesokkakensis]SLN29989.1 CHAP domain protein [Aquimixticola soesokkakensis]